MGKSRRDKHAVRRFGVPLIACAALLAAGCSQDSEASKASSPSADATATRSTGVETLQEAEKAAPIREQALSAEAQVEVKQAKGNYQEFAVKAAQALNSPANFRELRTVASGAALTEIQAMTQEYGENGYRVVGKPVVKSMNVRSINDESNPTSMVLAVCLDNSKIDVRNEAGESLRSSMSGSKRPVLNFYELTKTDGTWLVTGHSLPSDTSC